MKNTGVKTFSVSKEFEEDVNNILNSVPNISRFICEAIIEKYLNDKQQANGMPIEMMNQIILAMKTGNMPTPIESPVMGNTDHLEELRIKNRIADLKDPKEIVKEAIKQTQGISKEEVLNNADTDEDEAGDPGYPGDIDKEVSIPDNQVKTEISNTIEDSSKAGNTEAVIQNYEDIAENSSKAKEIFSDW